MAETIEIQKGDTLSGLSRSHSTTVNHLATTNGIGNPDLIYAGDPLIVPSPPAAPSVMSTAPTMSAPSGPTSAPTPSPHAETAPPSSVAPSQPAEPPADTPPDVPPAAQDGVEAGEESAEEKEDAQPEEVVCNCPADAGNASDKAAIVRAGGDENIDVIYAEAGGDAESQGLIGNAEGQIGLGLSRMDHVGTAENVPVGGSHQLNVMTANAQVEGGIVHGIGARGKAEASLVQHGASVFVGSDQNNPLGEAAGQYSLMSAEAKGNFLLGSDGNRAGVGVGFGAEAMAAKADATGEFNIPIPFTDWTISGRGKAGVSAGSAALGAQAHAYQNLDTERYHVGLGASLAALVGAKLDFDLSVGPSYDTRARPDGP